MNTRPTHDDEAATGNSTDEAAVRDLFRRLLDDWGRSDGEAYGSRFTEDADYVAFDGSHTRGRKEISSCTSNFSTGSSRARALRDGS